MDVVKLLKKFAKSEGIDPKKVDQFLEQYANPKTLEELENIPEAMLKHYPYISDVQGPLRDFIRDDMEVHRYETIDLDRILDILYDHKHYANYRHEKGELTPEQYVNEIDKLKKVEEHIIELRFGSVEFDW